MGRKDMSSAAHCLENFMLYFTPYVDMTVLRTQHAGYDEVINRRLMYHDAISLLRQTDHRNGMNFHKRYLAVSPCGMCDRSKRRALMAMPPPESPSPG